MTIQDAKTVSDEIEKGAKKKTKLNQNITTNKYLHCIAILSYGW